MIRLSASILISLLVTSFAFSQTSEQKERIILTGEQKAKLDEASRLNQSAIKLYNTEKYDEAFRLAQQVLQIREPLLGKQDEQVLAAMFNLASIQLMRGRALEAKSLFERVVAGYERSGGADNLKLVPVLDQLAVAYYRLEQPQDTERAYQRSLAIREKAFGNNHKEIAVSLRNLAEFYEFQQDYKQAEPLYQRLVGVRKKYADPETIADALERYACLLRKTKRPNEAEEFENQAREIDQDKRLKPQFSAAGVLNGKAIRLTQPPYPVEAQTQRASGKVTVRVLISESGTVIRACALEGPRLLMQVSENAAYHSKFSPTLIGDRPVKVTGLLIYNFVSP